jgi:FAD/FMN-containing dehydrogenase
MEVGRAFRNWSGLHRSVPRAWETPRSEAELAELLSRSDAAGRRCKAIGSGHSWSDAAVPEDVAIDTSGLTGVLGFDPAAPSITVAGGTRLEEITDALDARGFALPILGSIAKQTVAGAVATATHGSSLVHGNLSSGVLGMRLVTPPGEVLELRQGDPRLDAARVHLGAMGVVTAVTLRVVPAFTLCEEREALPFAEATRDLLDIARSAEFVKLWWLPSTGRAVVFRYRRTDEPAATEGLGRWVDEEIVNKRLFDAVLRMAGAAPGTTAWINAAVAATYLGASRRVVRSDRAFNLAMPPSHREAEWAFALEDAATALEALATLVRRDRLRINFPCEVRFVRGDAGWMSPAFGRDTCQIGVYQAESPDLAPWFAGAETIAAALGARPHWGKESTWDHRRIAAAMPRWSDFRDLVAELDPNGTMENAFLSRVLGPRRPAER